MKQFFQILFALYFVMNVGAQTQTVSNQKSIGDLGLLAQSSSTKLSDGSFILTSGTMSGISGDKSSPSFGEFDIWVVRVDANHNILWQKSFGGTGQDVSMMCKQTNQDDILIAGTSNSPISGNKTVGTNGDNDFWIIKINLNGDIIWQKNFGGIDSEKLVEIEIIDDLHYVLLGSSMSDVSGDKSEELRGAIDNWVVMIDSTGQKSWDKMIGGLDLEEPVCILYNNLENTIVIGSNSESNISGDKTENGQGDTDIWVLQLNLQGEIIHQKTIGGNNYDRIENIINDQNNSYYLNCTSASQISGDKTESSLGGYDFWIIKLNTDFEITWDKTFGGTGEDVSSKMIKTQNQQLIACGSSNSLSSEFKSEDSKGEEDVWIISIDTSGNLNWDKTIGGFQSDNGFNVIEKSPNNFAVFSYSSSGISGDKTAPNRGMFHFWMFDLTTTLGIDVLEQTNFTVYPNPAHDWIHVPFVENKSTVFTLTDAFGRIVDSGVLTATHLDVSTFQNGMYTLQLLTDDQVLVSRFVVQK